MTGSTILDVLRAGSVRSHFQPIVDLDSGAVVAYEALARGPQGPLHRPDHLFAAARAEGVLAELDHACRAAALQGAVEHGLVAPLTLFVNVEPEILDSAPLTELVKLADGAPGGLRVVVEMTERALAARPAELLRTVERIREIGWAVALDDVGADAMSLAFMPLLRPDVVKLDLRLVQDRPGPAVAQIMNAVNAYAEESGALVLAEGIEDEAHLLMARALGAQLGQGWLFGRPAAPPARPVAVAALPLPPAPAVPGLSASSPFAALPAGTKLRRAPKALLIELSKQLEREAARLGDTCVVASTFQEARHFTPATRSRYRDLAERVGFVCALGEELEVTVPGVRGAAISADDPVRGEWDVVVLAPHFAAALLARDLGDAGPERERTFEYALTYERTTVAAAAHSLLARVVPRRPEPVLAREPAVPAAAPVPLLPVLSATDPDAFLERALSATTSGVSIADVLRPDHPLVYVNSAFEELSGWRAEEVLGRNCRILQGPDTDRATVDSIRAAIDAGREWRGVLLNVRGPERTPWWNEVHLSPVVDASGRVVQYVGIQNDVTARVQAQQDLARERERSREYVRRIEEFAWTDPLTGLANRRRVEPLVEEFLSTPGRTTALLFCDLDGFKVVNDALGHAAGDDLLVEVAQRLRRHAPAGALLARLGGDEFLVALTGADLQAVAHQAADLAADLAARIADPFPVQGRQISVGVSVGVALGGPGEFFEDLLRNADHAMYRVKERRTAAV
ncbi:EAL domain-containing protein [Kineococcus aurantiacus]|uniref:Diguanylate cyclase (GGDEF)-like protein/PAS domain S-box-containing protein n=1 Tax=Kineococcus aurantiacus TaxID=37633 RepID=A0A7Y9DKJ7_9ACTN|nr:EAL domain-containing protein [Kineococcus aurantiacus]NYD22322.1 diguanylate cyclase (GGDEF)-like protein/PAS domain S-box-containing protein [Kineococcus aurantiacus]